jgi:hypothetical protein
VSRSAVGTGVLGNGAVGVRAIGSTYGVFADGGDVGVEGNGNGNGVSGHAGTGGFGVRGDGMVGIVGTGQIGALGEGSTNGVLGYSGNCGVRGRIGTTDPVLGGPAGVFGVYSGTAAGVGLQAWASGANATAFVAEVLNGALGGKVYGDFEVTGTINGALARSTIDHPLDPAGRYLSHALVQSPDMLSVYGGTVTLDGRGRATVRLPRYDQALNSDHRIQLTAVGTAAPGLHVAQKVRQGRFVIAGGVPGMEVFWQVSGIRSDPFARRDPLRVEARKSRQDRGKYLHPELYGQPRTERIGHEQRPRSRKAQSVRALTPPALRRRRINVPSPDND